MTSLILNTSLASNLKNQSQKTRVITETWVLENSFCPICGNNLESYPNNTKCADFYCKNCLEDFELKSKKNNIGKKIVAGEYNAMMNKINSNKSSNFLFLTYKENTVKDFFIIPKFFFSNSLIEKRKPLSETAKRAGWTGCNIMYSLLPDMGKIYYIKNGIFEDKNNIINTYNNLLPLKNEKLENKTWFLDIMKCIEDINKNEFTIKDMYKFEEILRKKHPNNNFIKDKIRQQLQIIRDRNYIDFIENGKYKIINKIK